MRSGFLNVLIFTLTCRFTAILFFQGTDDEAERLDDFLCRDVVRVVPFLLMQGAPTRVKVGSNLWAILHISAFSFCS